MALFTVGYEGRDPDGLARLLADRGVSALVDVRLNPISRKRGFSKKALAEAVGSAGIAYHHVRELGNPKEIRDRARSTAEALALYRVHMAPRWDESLVRVAELVRSEVVCLLCLEAAPHDCHRHIVAEELVRRLSLPAPTHL